MNVRVAVLAVVLIILTVLLLWVWWPLALLLAWLSFCVWNSHRLTEKEKKKEMQNEVDSYKPQDGDIF